MLSKFWLDLCLAGNSCCFLFCVLGELGGVRILRKNLRERLHGSSGWGALRPLLLLLSGGGFPEETLIKPIKKTTAPVSDKKPALAPVALPPQLVFGARFSLGVAVWSPFFLSGFIVLLV